MDVRAMVGPTVSLKLARAKALLMAVVARVMLKAIASMARVMVQVAVTETVEVVRSMAGAVVMVMLRTHKSMVVMIGVIARVMAEARIINVEKDKVVVRGRVMVVEKDRVRVMAQAAVMVMARVADVAAQTMARVARAIAEDMVWARDKARGRADSTAIVMAAVAISDTASN